MINVYQKTNLDFTKNGDGTLQPIRCDLSMEINGAWSLEIEVPYDEEGRWQYLVEGSIIIVDVDCIRELSNTKQRFRVYDYKKGVNSLTAIAFPVAMESTHDAPIENVVITNKTGAQAMTALQAFTNKYTLYSNIANTGSTALSNTNVNSAIASGKDDCFIQIWGGEICYDNLKFSVLNRLGENQAEKHPVIYGRNMTDVSYEKDDSGLITRLYPISQDGIRLSYDGKSYVDSPKILDYPIIHSRFIQAPYKLVIDDISNGSQTAVLTRTIQSTISQLVNTLSHSVYNSAVANKVEPEYIKKIRSDIVEAVQDMATANIYHADMNKIMRAAIKSSMDWLKDVSKPTWTWHDAGNDAWWYGASESSRAVSEYVYIDRIWRYFGDNAYWQRPKDDDSKKWDWIQESNGYRYGNNEKYYAQKTYVYITMDGQMKEYWFDEDGYWDGSDDTDSSYAWHGSGTSADPWWFGEEGATSEDTNKFLHDGWWFIDGTYYYFDEYGYYDGSTKFEHYQWDWVETSNSKWWFGNDANHNFARVYVTNQWLKVGGDWYRFDGNGYAIGGTALETEVINLFKTGMAQLKTTCETLNTQAYTLLYNLMKGYCDRCFAYQGIDVPTVTITVNMVDLSQTIEYKDYKNLEKVCLGDNVKCVDYEHGISTTERVVSITYDCIRRYNSTVTIGVAESTVADKLGVNAGGGEVSGGFDTSVIESTLTSHTNELARLDSVKQDKLTAGENITIVNNVISATGGGGGQGLRYFVETQDSLYGKSDIDIAHNEKYKFNSVVSAQWSDMKIDTVSGGVIVGIFEKIVIEQLRNQVDDGVFVISDDPAKVGLTFTRRFESGGGTVMYADCPTSIWDYGNFDADVEKGSFEFGGTTYYVIVTGTNGAVWEKDREEIGTLDNVDDYISHYSGGGSSDDGYFETVADFGYTLFTNSANEYYNGLSRKGKLAFFAGGTDDEGTDAPIKIYADGTADGLITQYDFDNADFTGATSQDDGVHGLVPQPNAGDDSKYLKGDGTWSTPPTGSTVVANPSGTATADLTKLQIDDGIYNIPQGGGGSGGVIPNPTGTPTDTLETIGFNDVLTEYALENGLVGASGGSYVYCNLDENLVSGTVYKVTLRDGSSIYDSQFTWQGTNQTITISGMELSIEVSRAGLTYYSGSYRNIYCDIYTELTETTIYQIEGGGGASGGSAYTETVLWENSSGLSFKPNDSKTVTLSDSLSNYDAISFVFGGSSNSNTKATFIVLTSDLVNYSTEGVLGICMRGSVNYNPVTYYVDNTHITFGGWTNSETAYAYKVVGLKYGGGSSSYVEEELYRKQGGSSTFSNIVLTKSVLDYDMIIAYSDWDFSGNYWGKWGGAVFTKAQLQELASASTDNNRKLMVSFDDDSTMAQYLLSSDGKTLTASSRSGSCEIRILVGLKFGGNKISYTTDEQVIGTWIDGKPLYRRTWNFSTGVTISSNSWQATDIAVADTHINVITDCKALNDDGQMMNYISATTDLATQTYVMLFNSRTNARMVVKYLTLEYTKTTD